VVLRIREGARVAADEISSPKVLMEKYFGSDPVSKAFSSGSGGACVLSSVAGSVMR
jgi:hypothetical protein